MATTSEPVTLSDDEDNPEITSTYSLKTKRRKTVFNCVINYVDGKDYTINLDDDSPEIVPLNNHKKDNIIEINPNKENDVIIEINDNDQNFKENYVEKKESLSALSGLYYENKIMSELIEKCLDLEHSEGMMRVIQRSLLRFYREADNAYLTSPNFDRALTKILKLLDTDPDRKFSHIKSLCEILKENKAKKRVELTTLATNLKGYIKAKKASKKQEKKRNKTQECVIDLDVESDEVEIQEDDVMVVEDTPKQVAEKDNVVTLVETRSEIVEYYSLDPMQEQRLLEPSVAIQSSESPKKEQSVNFTDYNLTIKHLEAEIAVCRDLIVRAEEEEVDWNEGAESAYLRSERYQKRLVQLYNELCTLTGSVPVKQRKVRLKVLDGHPAGPVRRLENLLNSRVGVNGEPPFPDFTDVVQCVIESNFVDELGWEKPRIMQEAMSLFTQCGRALKKRRQHREWRDLVAHVKQEPADDPADRDPALQRRLDDNKKLADKNETDLIEHYTRLQEYPLLYNTIEPPTEALEPDQTVVGSLEHLPANEHSASENCIGHQLVSEKAMGHQPMRGNPIETSLVNGHSKEHQLINGHSKEHQFIDGYPMEQQPASGIPEATKPATQSKPCITIENGVIQNPFMQDDYDDSTTDCESDEETPSVNNSEPNKTDSCNEQVRNSTKCLSEVIVGRNQGVYSYVNNNEGSNNGKVHDNQEPQVPTETKPDKSDGENCDLNSEKEVKIKKEHSLDITNLLDELGNNYTVSVLDIEDPFLFIEISDSSDDEDK